MTVATLLIIATLLPLGSFALQLFVGKRLGNPLAGIVGTLFVAGSFACSLMAMMFWLSADTAGGKLPGAGGQPIVGLYNWLPVGKWASNNGFLQVGLYIDSLTVVMFSMITLVTTVVHVFSIGYMAEDSRYPRFFTYLALFSFSMLGLVIGGTILQLFIFWEMVGLCSYLLIGFWYEKKSASNAAIKAFVTNRVGDFGFLIGLGILFYHLGNVTLPDVWQMLDVSKIVEGKGIQLLGGQWITPTLLTVMGIGLFFGAVGKSAQFPLHVWLPDAMEGPTPVSALIHAATMVAAGVYLVGRIFPILTADARLFIAIIGCITLTMAALIAMAQTDIKKVLAFSTLSQLGYMILAMGIGGWVAGLFHLITHAFFKALLFLGSGSVIHAAHHEQELTQYGGLWRKIPVTAACFGIGVLAIAGTPLLSGYYSKDLIIHNAASFSLIADHSGGLYKLLFWLPTIIAYVTAFYMMRCWMLTFAGKPRNEHLYNHAHETPILFIPLIVLAFLSIVGGKYLGVQDLLKNSVTETNNYFHKGNAPRDGGFGGFRQAWGDAELYKDKTDHKAHAFHEGEDMVHYVFPAFIVGIGLAAVIYWKGFVIANLFLAFAPIRWIRTWLLRRMFFDELYNAVFVGGTVGLAYIAGAFDRWIVDGIVNLAGRLTKLLSSLAGWHDTYVVDGAVNGAAMLAQDIGSAARAPQTGRIRMYVTMLVASLAAALAIAIGIVLLVISPR